MSPDRAGKSEKQFGYDGYLSPFTWRYGSKEMRKLFSEEEKRATWRRVWLALAEAEQSIGLLSRKELAGIRSKTGRKNLDIARAHRLERKIRHDLMAELRTFAEQVPTGGGKLHLGATSSDIEDNADVIIFREAVGLLTTRLIGCLVALREKIVEHKGTVCMGWTHLQPAEPTTLGYRFAAYAQDLVLDVKLLETVSKQFLKGKGVKGAVGTSASFRALAGGESQVRKMEELVMAKLGLVSYEITTQTYPRKADYILLSCLGSIAQSCHKFGFDLRVLQSPGFGELSEPVEDKQVGSSAMPFKRNPVLAERMCSLARMASVLPAVAFSNAANSLLERTLDDSASRRIAIPEAFLALDECLRVYEKVLKGLRVNRGMVEKNLKRYGSLAAMETVMMRMTQKGGDRQKIHEKMRAMSSEAWEELMAGKGDTIEKRLASKKWLTSKLTPQELHELMDPQKHVGDVISRCEDFVKREIDPIISKHPQSRARARTEY